MDVERGDRRGTTVRKGGIEVERVRLGKSELKVSPTAFGTWSFGGDWGRPVHLEDTAAAADIVLAPEDLAEIDYVLVDATAVWGPHPERMPAQDGGTG